VDGKLVVENGRERDRYVEGAIDLAAGPHDLLVRFQDRTSFTRIDVFWTPPGGERAIIPPEALRPATQPPEPPAALPGPVSALEPLKATEHRLLRRLGGQPALSRPRGVAVAPDGSVYVSDNGNARVVRFGPEGARLGEFGRPGDGEVEFLDPTDLTFDGAGHLVVLDSENAWVRWFDAEGRFLRRAVGPGAGFFHPRALTLDRAGRLVLADTGRSRLVVLDPNGQVLRQIGEKGTGDGQLIEPTGVALDASGNLYAADPTNGTFIKFSPEGEYQWHIVIPKGVTVVGPHAATAPDGWIYLTDPSRRQVLRIHPDTRAVERVVVLEDGREAPLGEPVGIAVDGAGRVYVADSGLNQVLVFAAR
jgi:DNA-binding beta-propeller fold protein YncE